MIDIHQHLLYGVDDGPRDLEASMAIAKAAIEGGITHVVCTPHANHEYEFNPTRNEERLGAIRERLGGKLVLGRGCDMYLSPANIDEAMENPAKFTINGGRYLLVEFASFTIPKDIGDTFYEFLLKGIVPVITHPERNPILARDPDQMKDWLGSGCRLQITAASGNGYFGREAKACYWNLLERDWVSFVATDAHHVEGRLPAMSEAYAAIARKMGEDTAKRLFVANPLAAFENAPLPEHPEFQAAQLR